MTWFRAWPLRVGVVAGLALGAGCSDDGLTPSAGETGGGGDEGQGGGTGSVSTTATATVTASAGGDATGGGDPSGGAPGGDTTGGDDGADESGREDGGTAGLSDSGGQTESTGGVDDGPAGSSGGDLDSGSSSDGGSSGGEDTGGVLPGSVCESDADCVVVDDCCACTAAHVDERPAACAETCDTTQCGAAGIDRPAAECVFGHCQLAKVACNGTYLSCDALPPDCPDGTLPSVDEDADCWTGACVPAEACDVVPGCSDCDAGEVCVQTATQIGAFYSCWPVDPACGGAPSCGCMGEVCTSPFVCGDGGLGPAELGCVCPVCG